MCSIRGLGTIGELSEQRESRNAFNANRETNSSVMQLKQHCRARNMHYKTAMSCHEPALLYNSYVVPEICCIKLRRRARNLHYKTIMSCQKSAF